jgi:hypothetical protein
MPCPTTSRPPTVEFYYDFAINTNIFSTYDFQEVFTPASNRDRGLSRSTRSACTASS